MKCYRGISLKSGPKPNEYIALTQWFTRNIKPYTYRKIHYNLWKWLLYEKKVISGSFRVNYWFSSYLFCRDGKSQQSLVLVDVWECRVIKPLEVCIGKNIYSWYPEMGWTDRDRRSFPDHSRSWCEYGSYFTEIGDHDREWSWLTFLGVIGKIHDHFTITKLHALIELKKHWF